jgi:hypothetical protein
LIPGRHVSDRLGEAWANTGRFGHSLGSSVAGAYLIWERSFHIPPTFKVSVSCRRFFFCPVLDSKYLLVPSFTKQNWFFGTSEILFGPSEKKGEGGGWWVVRAHLGECGESGAVWVVVIDLLPSFPDILLRSVYSLDPSEKASCRNCNNDMNGNRRHAYPLRLFTWEPPTLTYLSTRVYVCPCCDAL